MFSEYFDFRLLVCILFGFNFSHTFLSYSWIIIKTMLCTVCKGNITNSELTLYAKYHACNCSIVCYSCFLDLYIIDNTPPCKVMRQCKICTSPFMKDSVIQLFLFTLDYFSSEYYFMGSVWVHFFCLNSFENIYIFFSLFLYI